jgi:hypothetical protein
MVTRATRWFMQRLAMLLGPRRVLPCLGAFAFPTEIILMIISHLSKSSTTALALTYRILYSICSPRNITLDKTEKEELLLLLEKDLA